MKKHYLIKESTYFVDPHGDAFFGGTIKKIEFTDSFNDLDLSKTYNEYLEEVSEDDYPGSEDGYNTEYTELEILEITEDQANIYIKIIEDYKNI